MCARSAFNQEIVDFDGPPMWSWEFTAWHSGRGRTGTWIATMAVDADLLPLLCHTGDFAGFLAFQSVLPLQLGIISIIS